MQDPPPPTATLNFPRRQQQRRWWRCRVFSPLAPHVEYEAIEERACAAMFCESTESAIRWRRLRRPFRGPHKSPALSMRWPLRSLRRPGRPNSTTAATGCIEYPGVWTPFHVWDTMRTRSGLRRRRSNGSFMPHLYVRTDLTVAIAYR